MKRNLSTILLTSLVALGISSAAFPLPAAAISGNDFDAGRIMDDAVFFNPNTMSPSDIQAFLNAKLPNCDTNGTQAYAGTTRASYGASRGYPAPYTCLRDYSQNFSTKNADAYCSGSVTGGTKTAAQIIYDVSQACGVNPKVLLVLLQKEQSLITDDWPWSIQYRSATGYGCPDTAPCDAEYYGFFNQVYHAARQYQRYAKQASSFGYKAGRTNYIQYNPNASCGGSDVFIQNQATAGLYNYTPYQPNPATKAAASGQEVHCGAYGNINFWRMFIDWFGSTTSNVPYAWAYESQAAYSNAEMTQTFTSRPTVSPGGKLYVKIRARNMGTQTWQKSNTRVGTTRPQDKASPFHDTSWLSNRRPAALLEDSIAPGQIGTFQFAMKAPTTQGTYSEYFNILIEGTTWLNDPGLFFMINVNEPSTPPGGNNTLSSGQTLASNQYLLSADRSSSLSIQKSGNLTLRTNFKPTWQTGAIGSSSNRLVMQPDGNLVLYNGSTALWSSETNGNPGSRLVLQGDGNMVVYSSTNAALWASYSIHNPVLSAYINTSLTTGVMYPGQQILTANKQYKLVLQGDGNLVLYSPTRALWSTGTDGRNIAFLAMQGDGNLVLYDSNQNPIWFSRTGGHGSLRLDVQPDGNLVLYDILRRPYWHTATHGQ